MHSNTMSIMQEKFGANIAIATSGTPYWLLYSMLGGTLWTLDVLLHGMTLGTNLRMSAWQPVTTQFYPKAVHGNYYGLVAAAKFVNGMATCRSRL